MQNSNFGEFCLTGACRLRGVRDYSEPENRAYPVSSLDFSFFSS